MERFIRRENLKLLRDKLAHTTSEAECQRIVNLIEEQELQDRMTCWDGRAHTC